jgi:hypothetical protein
MIIQRLWRLALSLTPPPTSSNTLYQHPAVSTLSFTPNMFASSNLEGYGCASGALNSCLAHNQNQQQPQSMLPACLPKLCILSLHSARTRLHTPNLHGVAHHCTSSCATELAIYMKRRPPLHTHTHTHTMSVRHRVAAAACTLSQVSGQYNSSACKTQREVSRRR